MSKLPVIFVIIHHHSLLKGTVSRVYLVDNMKVFLLLSGHYEKFLVIMLNVRALLLCL